MEQVMKAEKRIKNLKEQVYEILKSNILTGVYKPGEKIHELDLANELNVSRSPIREALKQLIGEGLLESIPHKSITVKKFSEKEILDIFEFRISQKSIPLKRPSKTSMMR
jgi:DNA-binding GntR family transcriptional regulator